MSVWAILLRGLLSVVLMFNGTAAAAHAHAAHQAGSVTDGGGASACVGHARASAAFHESAKGPDPAPSRRLAPDCCEAGLCRCACVHAAAATMSMSVVAATPGRGLSVPPAVSGHADPAPRDLIRPPIG